jgi:hypothetical protein
MRPAYHGRPRAAPSSRAKAWKVYGDVEFPVYQRVNGNELIAPVQFKLIVSRSF